MNCLREFWRAKRYRPLATGRTGFQQLLDVLAAGSDASPAAVDTAIPARRGTESIPDGGTVAEPSSVVGSAPDTDDALADRSDEFEDPGTLTEWSRVFQTERTGADQLQRFDLGQCEGTDATCSQYPGHSHGQPRSGGRLRILSFSTTESPGRIGRAGILQFVGRFRRQVARFSGELIPASLSRIAIRYPVLYNAVSIPGKRLLNHSSTSRLTRVPFVLRTLSFLCLFRNFIPPSLMRGQLVR